MHSRPLEFTLQRYEAMSSNYKRSDQASKAALQSLSEIYDEYKDLRYDSLVSFAVIW